MKMISIDVRSSGVETVWGEKGGNAVSASQKEKEKICMEVPTKILIYSLITNLIFDLFITTITVTLSHYPTMSVTDETKAVAPEAATAPSEADTTKKDTKVSRCNTHSRRTINVCTGIVLLSSLANPWIRHGWHSIIKTN
jgi:hypothetical protein